MNRYASLMRFVFRTLACASATVVGLVTTGCGDASSTSEAASAQTAGKGSAFDVLCWQLQTLADVESRVDPTGFKATDCDGNLVAQSPADYFGKSTVNCDASKGVVVVKTQQKGCGGSALSNSTQTYKVSDNGHALLTSEVIDGEETGKTEESIFSGDGDKTLTMKTVLSEQDLTDPKMTIESDILPQVAAGALQCPGKAASQLEGLKAVHIAHLKTGGTSSASYTKRANGKYGALIEGKLTAAVTLENGSQFSCESTPQATVSAKN